MADLNVMLREHALSGLQSQLDAAVTAGDTEAARKVSEQMSDLKAAMAPKPRPYGDAEIKAELSKLDWFGMDPKKTSKAMEFGKTMDPAKFSSAAAFAAAVVKAVEEEFKPAPKPGDAAPDDDNEDDNDGETGEGQDNKPAPKRKASDAPGERDAGAAARSKSSGPWTKLSDAPNDVRVEITRQADKFTNKKEDREKFVATALETAYNMAQRAKRK